MPEGQSNHTNHKLVASGSHKVYRQRSGKTILREYQWNTSQSTATFDNAQLIRCELRRSARTDEMVNLHMDYTIQNAGAAPIRFFNLLSCVEKIRVLINSTEVLHYNNNDIVRTAVKNAWLEHYRDEKERDNSFYSECGQPSFLDAGNEINAVTIPAGGSVEFHTQVDKLISFFHNLPMSAIGLVELEITLSSVPTQCCDGNLSDLSVAGLRVWSNHKHYASLPPPMHASHTLHFKDYEIHRLTASENPFTAATGVQYDLSVNTLFPYRKHISRLSVYAIDSAGTDPFIRNIGNWVREIDILKSGVSYQENMLNSKQKIFRQVSKFLRSEGTYAPTNPGQVGHSSAFLLDFVSMSAVVEAKNDQLSHIKAVVPSEVDNRDQLTLRLINDAVLPVGSQIVYCMEFDAFWRLAPNGAVVKVDA